MLKNNYCKPLLTACALLSLSTGAMADKSVTEKSESSSINHETTGALTGAVVGGIAGGPIGAVLAAAAGNWIGDAFNAKNENKALIVDIKSLNNELGRLENEKAGLKQQQLALQENLKNLKQESEKLKENTDCCFDTALTLHYKTASAEIEQHYSHLLNAFAKTAKEFPEAIIEIEAHTDRRGEPSPNKALARARINKLSSKLISLGIASDRIQTVAIGESQPVTSQDSLENNFFDRRVYLKLTKPAAGFLTSAGITH